MFFNEKEQMELGQPCLVIGKWIRGGCLCSFGCDDGPFELLYNHTCFFLDTVKDVDKRINLS